MADRFRGRRALVTGASRGIGAAVAERLAAEGAHIAIAARTLEKHDHLAGSLLETQARCEKYGRRVAIVVADLANAQDRLRVVPEAMDSLDGPIEILVNNAAAAMYQDLYGFPLRRRQVIFEVNVHAPLDLAQAVIPDMRAAGEGWIVNLSSGTARLSDGPPFRGAQDPILAIYGASKAALNRITNALGVELYGTGIRVNTIEPRAAVLTEGSAEFVRDRLRPDQFESIQEMAEGVVALCDCPPDFTAQVAVSLELINRWRLALHNLDATPR